MLNLYKLGGFYMDLDYVTLKAFNETHLWNFVAYEGPDGKLVTNSVFHLQHGHRIIKEIIKSLCKNYSADQ